MEWDEKLKIQPRQKSHKLLYQEKIVVLPPFPKTQGKLGIFHKFLVGGGCHNRWKIDWEGGAEGKSCYNMLKAQTVCTFHHCHPISLSGREHHACGMCIVLRKDKI